jgi:hypothetical protein
VESPAVIQFTRERYIHFKAIRRGFHWPDRSAARFFQQIVARIEATVSRNDRGDLRDPGFRSGELSNSRVAKRRGKVDCGDTSGLRSAHGVFLCDFIPECAPNSVEMYL